MKQQKNASSIIEAMVVLLVVITGIVGVYSLLDASLKLSDSTAHRIEAIQIARDGLEAMTNIRDTNWLLFSADTKNCWNTLNYNNNCVGNTSLTHDIRIGAGQGLIISRDSTNKFILSATGITTDPAYSNTLYRNRFKVLKDSRGFYTQDAATGTGFSPLFTREIQIAYIDTNGGAINSNDEKMEVTAIVQWTDTSTSTPKRLEMSTILTNWKQ